MHPVAVRLPELLGTCIYTLLVLCWGYESARQVTLKTFMRTYEIKRRSVLLCRALRDQCSQVRFNGMLRKIEPRSIVRVVGLSAISARVFPHVHAAALAFFSSLRSCEFSARNRTISVFARPVVFPRHSSFLRRRSSSREIIAWFSACFLFSFRPRASQKMAPPMAIPAAAPTAIPTGPPYAPTVAPIPAAVLITSPLITTSFPQSSDTVLSPTGTCPTNSVQESIGNDPTSGILSIMSERGGPMSLEDDTRRNSSCLCASRRVEIFIS